MKAALGIQQARKNGFAADRQHIFLCETLKNRQFDLGVFSLSPASPLML